jgi:transposase
MEDVLDVYQRPLDPRRPLVCLDEKPVALHGETRVPRPAAPGVTRTEDYEYVRQGTANLFMVFEPLTGHRRVKATERRTAQDFAHVLQELVDRHPTAERIVLVMDNLNTHKLGSLYETFAPAEARRIAAKLEIHYTPKHGSWLNIAEIELSVLERQSLRRRIPDLASLARETSAWADHRDQRAAQVSWRFTTEDARIKLKRLYPSLND